ncbi:Phosphoribosylaminoimidazole carboxylase, chloroplastic [Symbiodinium microadriaticum]|uniref:phosphoribosylaminoimidazole carboxylase n=2 Tax=Symbiodinium TaxID=2949 RepID=A0A1Q9E6C2_SYMMI|nr:Phosphoribosylaminoimidazole carboxylase, chloroplastic [Symbiodinium microadriaticum]
MLEKKVMEMDDEDEDEDKEACGVDQFEQHLRCVLGLPLGDCQLRVGGAMMVNILGQGETPEMVTKTMAPLRRALLVPDAGIHWYGKEGCAKGRKMGNSDESFRHITVTGFTPASALEEIRPVLAAVDGDDAVNKLDAPRRHPSGVPTKPAPSVGIIMGSDSDLPTMKDAAQVLDDFGIPYEISIVSAHRTPEYMLPGFVRRQLRYEYATTAEARGINVIIAGAGGAACFGVGMGLRNCPDATRDEMVAVQALKAEESWRIGVPVKSSTLSGNDSLLSIVQMPKGTVMWPVGARPEVPHHKRLFDTMPEEATATHEVKFREYSAELKLGFKHLSTPGKSIHGPLPRGIPVATVAIGNAANAGLLAVRILGAANPGKLVTRFHAPTLWYVCVIFQFALRLMVGSRPRCKLRVLQAASSLARRLQAPHLAAITDGGHEDMNAMEIRRRGVQHVGTDGQPLAWYEWVFANPGEIVRNNEPEFVVTVPQHAVPCEIVCSIEQFDPRMLMKSPGRPQAVPILCKVYEKVNIENTYSDHLVSRSNWIPVRDAMVAFTVTRGGEYLIVAELPSGTSRVERMIFRCYASQPHVMVAAHKMSRKHRLVESRALPGASRLSLVGLMQPDGLDKDQPVQIDWEYDAMRKPEFDLETGWSALVKEVNQDCAVM